MKPLLEEFRNLCRQWEEDPPGNSDELLLLGVEIEGLGRRVVSEATRSRATEATHDPR